jgi:predicted neuraminidase
MKTILISFSIVMVSITLAGQNPFRGDKSIIKSEFIYQPEDVKFPSCHASTITQTTDGLLAAWFGGTAEKNPDVGIWVSRYSAGKWARPEEAANGLRDNQRFPCWNPVLFNARDEILLFYKVGPSPSEWWGELITSSDNGISWSPSHRLPEGITGPVKNKPVMLADGTLLCPSSTENDGWRVHMEMTADNGLTWERTPPLNGKDIGAIQPSILVHDSGKLQIVCRSRQQQILTAWSDDGGKNWSPLTPTSLPNPNSGIDAVTLKDGRFVLVYNHLKTGRNILNVAVSEDGMNWKAAVLLENDKKGTEYSYPAVIQTTDGMIHITYTWQRRLIKHVVINPRFLVTKPFVNGEWPEE